jgi:hypothetical protein
MQEINKYQYLWLSIVFITTILLIGLVYDISRYPLLIAENGIIESLSVIGYIACIVLILVKGGLNFAKKYNYFVALLVLFALRELDFDKKFTTMGILKSKFYFSANVPIIEKVIGVCIILIILYIIIKIIKHHLIGCISKIKQQSLGYIGFSLTFIILLAAKTIDGMERKLASVNIDITQNLVNQFLIVEEILELGIPIMIFTTIYIVIKDKNTSHNH